MEVFSKIVKSRRIVSVCLNIFWVGASRVDNVDNNQTATIFTKFDIYSSLKMTRKTDTNSVFIPIKLASPRSMGYLQ